MKILFITPKIPFSPIDGHKKSMFGVIKYLSKLGCEIDLIAYRQDEDPGLADGLRQYANIHLLDVQTPNSITGAFRNLFSRVPYNLWKFQRSELTEYLQQYFENNIVDIVHIVNAHMGWIVNDLRKLTKAKIVLRQENLELSIMEKFYKNQSSPAVRIYSFLQYKKFLKYEPELCSKFDLCVMMSKQDEDKLLALNSGVKTTVIPLGAEEDLFRINRVEKIQFSLFHLGSLAWYPNLDGIKWFLKEIFPKVLEKYPLSRLYLYGGGMPGNFEIDEKINSSIVIKGFVEDIWREINDKQLAIVPLRIGSGIRVKIIELLAAGQNIIATSLGVEGIPLQDGKDIFVADSADEFVEKICRIFNDEYDSKKIAERGRKIIRDNFGWSSIAERFQQEYNKLLNK